MFNSDEAMLRASWSSLKAGKYRLQMRIILTIEILEIGITRKVKAAKFCYL